MYFCVNGFEVGVNDSIFSGNEQQKVYYNGCVVFNKLKLLWIYIYILLK